MQEKVLCGKVFRMRTFGFGTLNTYAAPVFAKWWVCVLVGGCGLCIFDYLTGRDKGDISETNRITDIRNK